MVTGFVLINVKPKCEESVYKTLLKLPDIEGIRQVFGEYDMIARLEAETLADLKGIILNKIRSIDGVARTATLVTIE